MREGGREGGRVGGIVNVYLIVLPPYVYTYTYTCTCTHTSHRDVVIWCLL